MAANSLLKPVQSMGFGNLLRKEFSLWWSTHRWWKQLILWLVITNGLLILVGFGAVYQAVPMEGSLMQTLTQVYFALASLSLPIGAILAVQDAIIGERQSGTAEWILSKPISRRAFVLAKLVGHGLSFLALGVVAPCIVAFGHIAAWAGEAPELAPFVTTSGLLALNALFYLTLALMLGTWFNVRSAVTGSAIGFLFSGSVLPSLFPELIKFTPWKIVDFGVAWIATGGRPPGLAMPLVASLAWMLAFVLIALLRFEREEL